MVHNNRIKTAAHNGRSALHPQPQARVVRRPSSQGVQRPANRIPASRPATSSSPQRPAVRPGVRRAVSQVPVPQRRQTPSSRGFKQRTGAPSPVTGSRPQPSPMGPSMGQGTKGRSTNARQRPGPQRVVSLRPGTFYYCMPIPSVAPGPVQQPSVQTPHPSPRHPSGGTPRPSPRQPQNAPQAGTPPIKAPCHTCGLRRSACTVLNRFPFNSAQLGPKHKQQIRILAQRILRENANTIIATGHTDKVGTDSYNLQLGGRRAAAVIRELRSQLHNLKPGVQRNIFWRLATKGESQPVSKTDASLNRRVHVCVKKVKI